MKRRRPTPYSLHASLHTSSLLRSLCVGVGVPWRSRHRDPHSCGWTLGGIFTRGGIRFALWVGVLAISLVGCTPSVPESATAVTESVHIYPDYTAVTIPPNIAPMNFTVEEEGDAFVTELSVDGVPPLVVSGKTVDIPLDDWRTLLHTAQGKSLKIQIYVEKDGTWRKYPVIENTVSADPIDGYVFYRLIEPGYEFFDRLSLNQRPLESFDATAFFRNDLVRRGMCINCHSFQNRQTKRFLFHLRAYLGGTMFVQDGVPEKRNVRMEELLSACVYPSWHPTDPLVAFSVNDTFQSFHTVHRNRIEVIDAASDLVLYDASANQITPIFQTDGSLETFPNWSQDGKWLYYCSALAPPEVSGDAIKAKLQTESASQVPALTPEEFSKKAKGRLRSAATDHYSELKYNILRIPFDTKTRTFGEVEMVVDAASQQQSVVHPRLSPDGRYLLYTQSNYGNFPIWHREADLWLLDLETGTTRSVQELNSSEAESYHTWSSSGRWIVFSSRRDDSLYTRLYFAHFSQDGTFSKPFLLPQRDPQQNLALFKSYNIPEFTVEPIGPDIMELVDAAKVEEPPKATFVPNPLRGESLPTGYQPTGDQSTVSKEAEPAEKMDVTNGESSTDAEVLPGLYQ